jgi:hypothetical protein
VSDQAVQQPVHDEPDEVKESRLRDELHNENAWRDGYPIHASSVAFLLRKLDQARAALMQVRIEKRDIIWAQADRLSKQERELAKARADAAAERGKLMDEMLQTTRMLERERSRADAAEAEARRAVEVIEAARSLAEALPNTHPVRLKVEEFYKAKDEAHV